MSHGPKALVETFAAEVAAQDECIRLGDAEAGNAHARKYTAVAQELLSKGEDAIENFATLLAHKDDSVRVMAAAFLLESRTENSVAVLRQIAKGAGLAALGAKRTLNRYSRGILRIGP
jgi:hypothetical protein